MFSSATASPAQTPFFTPIRTPQYQSPNDSPSHSRSLSPASIQLSLTEKSFITPVGGVGADDKASLLLRGHDDSRRSSKGSSLLVMNGESIHYESSEAVAATAIAHRRPDSSNGSRIVFHLDGNSNNNLFGGYHGGNDSNDQSRSDTPTSGVELLYSYDQLSQLTEVLSSGISTVSHEIKRKDSQGRTFQNAFMGKEAVNFLRTKLPKGANSHNDCMHVLQQMLNEGFIIEAQSLEDFHKQIVAKFQPTSTPPNGKAELASGKSSPKVPPSNALAFKVPANIGGAASDYEQTFKKDSFYQLSKSFLSQQSAAGSANNSALPSMFNTPLGSNNNSARNSPLPSNANLIMSPMSSNQWYSNYGGYLGKKRENKGLGNSLALGLGVSTFQKRWFVVSAAQQAVLYYKEDPALSQTTSSASGKEEKSNFNSAAAYPLGFIPFSEILFVDHLASSDKQLAMQQSISAGLNGKGHNKSTSKLGSKSGTSTPNSNSNTLQLDEKQGRFFDIIANYRVYHLQADSCIEAMKWVQAIKENIRESARVRAEKLSASSSAAATLGGSGAPGNERGTGSGIGNTLRMPLVKTPRTPDNMKRFWSNQATPHTNPNSFPIQRVQQKLLAIQREQVLNQAHTQAAKLQRNASLKGGNGLYGSTVQAERISDLRHAFFQLNFSISSLNQCAYFDQLQCDFPDDASIVEFCWNLIMKGSKDADNWGPSCFKNSFINSGAHSAHAGSVPFTQALNAPIIACASPPSYRQQLSHYVNGSSSTGLLNKWKEVENAFSALFDNEFEDVESKFDSTTTNVVPGDLNTSSSSGATGRVLKSTPHRRSISCSRLPDSFGRPLNTTSSGRNAARSVHFDFGGGRQQYAEDDSEYSRSSRSSRTSRSSRRNMRPEGVTESVPVGCEGIPNHKRAASDLWPFSRGALAKLADFDYMLLNRYALYHTCAVKIPTAAAANMASASSAHNPNLLNPSFLYRIFQPYRRLESWLHTDAFLNFVLNDETLLNEVPLALPLIWLVLQWRNHDSEVHIDANGSSSVGGFVDDSVLRKNWLDDSVDGEDDGFRGQGVSEEEEAALLAQKTEQVKKGFKSVARAHLRVNSFSTMADPLSAIRSQAGKAEASASASPQPPLSANPLSPSPPAPIVGSMPIVYGAHGQILAGGRHPLPPMGSPLSVGSSMVEYPVNSPMQPHSGFELSPVSPMIPLTRAVSDPLSSPVGNVVRIHTAAPTRAPPPLVRSGSGSSLGGDSPLMSPIAIVRQHSGSNSSNQGAPLAEGSDMTPQRRRSSENESNQAAINSTERERNSSTSSENEPGAGTRYDLTAMESPVTPSLQASPLAGGDAAYQPSGLPPTWSASAPTTRRNSLAGASNAAVAAAAASATKRLNVMDPSVSFATASSLAPPQKRGSDSTPYAGPIAARSGVNPASPPAPNGSILPSTSPVLTASASVPASPQLGAMRSPQRERGAIFQTSATLRPPNLLAGGPSNAHYTTLRGSCSFGTAGSSSQIIPLDLPHWKIRGLVNCRYCFQSSLEFMQAISERYGMNAGTDQLIRARAQAIAQGKKMPAATTAESMFPENKFTISLSNTLFSLLLNPLYTLPSLSASGEFNSVNTNPVLQDTLNVLGKVILSPHIWPTIMGCLHSNESNPTTTIPTGRNTVSPSSLFLKHHVLKDLNTLFIGSNLAANNRNCKLLFKFFQTCSMHEQTTQEEYNTAIAQEKEFLKKCSEKDREKYERKRKRHGPITQKPTIGAWQKGLLNILKNHVPIRANSSPFATGLLPTDQENVQNTVFGLKSTGIDRLHNKVYQYTLNLFGVFHFYKFQCIGSAPAAAIPTSKASSGSKKDEKSKSTAAGKNDGPQYASCEDFEKLFKNSFWRSMSLHQQGYVVRCEKEQAALQAEMDVLAKNKEHSSSQQLHVPHEIEGSVNSANSLSSKKSGTSSAGNSVHEGMNGRGAKYSVPDSSVTIREMQVALDHTVARSMLTTMLQRLIFKIKSKTCSLEQRWPAVSFLVQLVKSFVFSTPLQSSSASNSHDSEKPSVGHDKSGSGSFDSMHQDFLLSQEKLHASASLNDDIELMEKCLELLKHLRLHQEIDSESLSITKQRELKTFVEKESASASKGSRMVDLYDPVSKYCFNAAHEDLVQLYANLVPRDQDALRCLQNQVLFLKDAICFLAILHQKQTNTRAITIAPTTSRSDKEVGQLVSNFIHMDRREKVFCSIK